MTTSTPADEPSLLLLRFLGDALAEAGVLLVASYREAERRVRELGDVFAELARVGTRIPLRGLTSADLEAYVGTVTGSQPTHQAVARLHEITGGNPFFLGEIVRLLAADDTLGSLDETTKDPFLRIPEEVRALIRRRVATLSHEAVVVLRVAAVIGREFELHVLQRTSRLTPARLLGVLGEAAAVGVIAELPSTPRRYSFAHELVRETLYDDLPPARRLELHREVGLMLETVYGDDLDPHLSEIARHLYLAAPLGDAGQALEYLVRAGDRASAVLAYEDAAAHYRHALELLALVEDASGEQRTELLLRLADAQWRSGDGAEARTTFEQAIEGGRRLGNGELLAQAALGYVTALGGFLLYARFEVGGTGIGLLEEALSALPPVDSSLRAHLLAHLALEMWSGNEPVERRVAVSQEAIEMARRLGDSEALVTALHSRHWALTTPGMALERLAHSEEMLRRREGNGQSGDRVSRPQRALPLLSRALRPAWHGRREPGDDRARRAAAAALLSVAHRLSRTLRATLDGRFPDAERLAEEALELGRVRQSEYATYVFRYAQLLAIRWAQGSLPELWPQIEDHADRFPWIPRWREALAAAERGDDQLARRELERHAARDFADLPRDGLWILHLCTLADVCVLVGDEGAPSSSTSSCSRTPTTTPSPTHSSRSAQSRSASASSLLCSGAGRRPIATSRLRSPAASCSARGRSAPASSRACRAPWRRAANRPTAAAGRDARGGGGSLRRARHGRTLRSAFSALGQHPFGQTSAVDAVFRREGEFWTIAYEGQTFRLRDVKGLRYIASLLASPGRDMHVLELVSAATGRRRRRAGSPSATFVGSWPSDLDPLLDDQAKEDYGRRLEELEEELEQARDWGDTERAARLEDELDLLTQELARAVGLRGRDRTFSSPAERARISVTKAIRTAIRLHRRALPRIWRRTSRPRSRPGASAPTPPPAHPHPAGPSDVSPRAERSFRRDSRPWLTTTDAEESL